MLAAGNRDVSANAATAKPDRWPHWNGRPSRSAGFRRLSGACTVPLPASAVSGLQRNRGQEGRTDSAAASGIACDQGILRSCAGLGGDLARFLLIRHHTAVELVNRMVKLGLLSRLVDDEDGRRVLVRLTKKGEQKLQALSRIHIEELRSVSPALGKILRSLRRSLGR